VWKSQSNSYSYYQIANKADNTVLAYTSLDDGTALQAVAAKDNDNKQQWAISSANIPGVVYFISKDNLNKAIKIDTNSGALIISTIDTSANYQQWKYLPQ